VKFHHIITIITVVILIGTIAIPAVITVQNRHNERLLYATTMKIKERAKTCFHKEECLETKITLKKLYELGYLEPMAHPITKEYYNENSYVLISESRLDFFEVKNN